MTDLLLPHLLDFVGADVAKDLILAGGYGILLKYQHLVENNVPTLYSETLDMNIRPTQDMDFFVPLNFWTEMKRAEAVRKHLNKLGYTAEVPNLHFAKPWNDKVPEMKMKMKIDLLARLPREEKVQVRDMRVGKGPLHARHAAEGFAIDDSPIRVSLRGNNSQGVEVEAEVLVPHPYAFLNLKVKAAYDWLQEKQGKQAPKPDKRLEKHVADVYRLVGMLTDAELAEAEKLASQYAAAEDAVIREHVLEVQRAAEELFGAGDTPGVREIQRQLRLEKLHPGFQEALWQALGIAPQG